LNIIDLTVALIREDTHMTNLKLPRRSFLRLAGGAAAVPAVSRIARAQSYPTRPITLVVPFPAGGATDVVARVLAKGLSERIGQSVVVDNRPGANGAIGSASVAKARPDGYTLVMGGVNTHAMNDSLIKPRPYDSGKDFAPITLTALIPIAFVVNPQLPVTTLQELVALARSKPKQLSYGSSGAGGPQHLAMELFKLAAGLDIVHVPYRGGAPQLNDLVGGHILIGSIGLPPALPHIETGKLRALAVTDAKRSVFLPKLPTVAESGFPNFEMSYWLGLMAPAGTPRDIIDRLASESVAVLTTPDTRDGLAKQGAEVATSTPDEFKRIVEKDIEKWSKLIQDTGITAE
jgi:tripartite-type tricarboxylate transporter receptor subunit TctC